MNLKPYFYLQSLKVGGVGCLIAGVAAYNLFFVIATRFGVSSDVPLRNYENGVVFTVFTLCILILLISLYVSCALSAAIFYGLKLKKGQIDTGEFINIVFKSTYPKRWQKGI